MPHFAWIRCPVEIEESGNKVLIFFMDSDKKKKGDI